MYTHMYIHIYVYMCFVLNLFSRDLAGAPHDLWRVVGGSSLPPV